MLIDLTLEVTPQMIKDAQKNEKKAFMGHLGTHFDVMNKTFPLEYTRRKAIVFDVSGIQNKDIGILDIDLSKVEKDMFVTFYSGFIQKIPYGEKEYFLSHPQLSDELIEKLIERKISLIGVDFAGIRRGVEHTKKDAYCADRGVFVVENLCNLDKVLNDKKQALFVANTYPINYSDMTGLPCRVVAEL